MNVQKFSGSIRDVELRHLNEAKQHFKQLGSTWKFDHLWPLLQNQEKFRSSATSLPSFRQRRRNFNASQSDNSSTQEAPTHESQGLSEFAINLDEDTSSRSSQRPIGIKRAESKRKADDEISKALSIMAKCSEQMVTMVAMMQNFETHRHQQLIEVKKKRAASREC